MRSLRTRIKNIEKTAAAEADKPFCIVTIRGDIYNLTYNKENFTGTEAEYSIFKATHDIDDSHSIMVYVVSA